MVLFQQAGNGEWCSPLKCHIVRGDLRDGEEARGSGGCKGNKVDRDKYLSCIIVCSEIKDKNVSQYTVSDYLIQREWKQYSSVRLQVLQS